MCGTLKKGVSVRLGGTAPRHKKKTCASTRGKTGRVWLTPGQNAELRSK